MTAHGTVKNAVQVMRCGAVDVLLKPISLDALRDLVDRVFREPSTPPDATPYDEWVQFATWHLRYRRTEAAVERNGETRHFQFVVRSGTRPRKCSRPFFCCGT